MLFPVFFLLGLEELQFLFQNTAHAVLGKVHLGDGDAKLPADLGRIPFPQHVVVENLELLGGHLGLDAFQRGLQKVVLPFPLPYLVKVVLALVRNLVDGVFLGFAGVRIHQHGRVLFPFAELVVDAPAGHVPEP